MRAYLTAALALLASAAFAVTARAGVDVEVPMNFKAKGTLSQAGEQDVYRVLAERGTTFTFTLTPVGKTGFTPIVEFRDSEGTPIEPSAGTATTSGGKVSIKGLQFADTDEIRIVIYSEGIGGDYSLSLKGKAQTAWKTTVAMGAAVSYDFFVFAALPGSTVTVTVKASKGSAAVPRLQTLYSADESYSVDLSGAGKTTPTSQTATQAGIQNGLLEMFQDFQNTGAAGNVDVLVKVKPPKGKPGKLDLRGAILGRPFGGETLVSRVIGSAGGTVSVDDASSDLDKASVTIPAEVLAGDMTISVSSAADPDLGSGNLQAAGPAVDLQPSGIVFSSPVTVTLPLDFSKLPDGYSTDDIQVRIVEENGTFTTVAPDSIDVGAGTVTVLANGFSVCIPIVPPGPPSFGYNPNGTLKPGGDEYWFAGLGGELQTSGGNDDSRNRQFSLEEGQVSLYADKSIQIASQKTKINWSNADTGPGQVDGTVVTTATPNGGSATWAYGADGQTLTVDSGDAEYPVFAISRDGNVLSSRTNDHTNPDAENIFAIRKPTQTPTLALAAGNYQGCGFSVDVSTGSGASGSASLSLRRNFGTLTIAADGSFSVTFNERRSQFNSSTNTWTSSLKTETAGGPAGSIVVEEAGTLLATFADKGPENTPEPKRIYLGRDFKGGFFTHASPKSGNFILFLFAREGSGLSTASLDGTYRGGLFDTDVRSYSPPSLPGVNIADFDLRCEGVTCTLTGGATGNLSFHDLQIQRNSGVAGGVEVFEKDESASVSVTVTPKGKVTFNTGMGAGVGAVAPDASFIVLGTDVTDTQGDYFVGICVQSPPLKP